MALRPALNRGTPAVDDDSRDAADCRTRDREHATRRGVLPVQGEPPGGRISARRCRLLAIRPRQRVRSF